MENYLYLSFWQQNDGYLIQPSFGAKYHLYKCDTQRNCNSKNWNDEKKNKNDNKTLHKYSLIWNDFLSVHCNLIQTKLKEKLIRYCKTNCSNSDYNYNYNKDIEYLFDQFKFCRNACAMLPIKCINNEFDSMNRYKKMIDHFSKNNNEIIIQYCIIYNCIATMFLTHLTENNKHGIDGIIKNNYDAKHGRRGRHNVNINNNSSKNGNPPTSKNAFDFFDTTPDGESTTIGSTTASTSKSTNIFDILGDFMSNDDPFAETTTTTTTTPSTKTKTTESAEPVAMEKVTSQGDKTLSQLVSSYMLEQIVQTSIFGTFKTDMDSKSIQMKAQAMVECKEILFDNDLTQFDQLIKYCIQDISNNSDGDGDKDSDDTNKYKYVDIYSINTSPDGGGMDRCDYGFGIVFYIINRLSFVIFNDLNARCSSTSQSNIESSESKTNDDENNRNSEIIFPKLRKLFEFLYNFSVYLHCYPSFDSENNETFYVSQYMKLKHTLYDNIFNDNDKNVLNIRSALLNKFNYFYEERGHGTILHSAVSFNLRHYCNILIQDGFDHNKPNRQFASQTAYDIAKEKNNRAILSLMQNINNNNNESSNDNSELKTFALWNDKSSELKYHSFLNQLMFAKYILMILGCNVQNETILNLQNYNNFYVNINQFRGLMIDNMSSNTQLQQAESGMSCMDELVMAMIQLLNARMPLSEDLLILCFEYCKLQREHSYYNMNEHGNSNVFESEWASLNTQETLYDKFTHTLNRVTKECLSSDKNNKDANYFSARNYQWFKSYLLHSHIWMAACADLNPKNKYAYDTVTSEYKDDPTEGENELETTSILFDELVRMVNQQLKQQKKVKLWLCSVCFSLSLVCFFVLLFHCLDMCW